ASSPHALHPFPTRRSSDLPQGPFLHSGRRMQNVEPAPSELGSQPQGSMFAAHRRHIVGTTERGCGPCASKGWTHEKGRHHRPVRSEEHTSELQSREKLVCR